MPFKNKVNDDCELVIGKRLETTQTFEACLKDLLLLLSRNNACFLL